jgi:hypothetical protein
LFVVIRDDGPRFVPESDEYLNRRNPVDIEGLVQCTLGGPMTLYNGGHLQGPGPPLRPPPRPPRPPGRRGALVTNPEADAIEFQLVNVDDRAVEVTLPAGTRTAMELETRRYVNDPDYAFPWDR